MVSPVGLTGVPGGAGAVLARVPCQARTAETVREAAMTHGALHGVTLQQHFETVMTEPTPRFGFVAFAETWNGRLAMLGFIIGLATELLTGQGILQQIGLG